MTEEQGINEYVAERLYYYAIPRTLLEAECFLWNALWHLTEGAILCRVPRRRVDAGKVIRQAIERLQAEKYKVKDDGWREDGQMRR